MRPIIIVAPNLLDAENIKALRDNDICVVVAEDPSKVKFIDPIPAQSSRTKIEDAAIALSRKILKHGTFDDGSRRNFASMYVDLLINGTPLSQEPTQEEQEKQAYDYAKIDEIRKMAREDAKAEREAKKKGAKNPA
jgi:hypothetical protein